MTRRTIQRSAIAVAAISLAGVAGVMGLLQFLAADREAHAQQPASQKVEPRPAAVDKPSPAPARQPALDAARRATSQPAQVVACETAEILAKASGFVSVVHVDIGDRVEKDQVLAELWIPEMDQELLLKTAAVAEAWATVDQMAAAIAVANALLDASFAELQEKQAGVAHSAAELEFRRSEHDRIARLVGAKTLNEALLDEKRKWLRTAESSLAAARAAVASSVARIEVERARVKQSQANERHAVARLKVAKLDLKRTEVLMAYGQVKDRLRIVADIPESEAPRIRVGQRAEFQVDTLKTRSFSGSVKRTAGVLDARTRSLRVEAELSSPPPELRPGMFGVLTITFDESPPPP